MKKVARTLRTGLGVAAGLLIANWLIVPAFSGRTHAAGFVVGLIAALLALVIYVIMALVQTGKETETQ